MNDAPTPERTTPSRWRLLALALVFVVTLVVARSTGVTEHLTLEGIRSTMEGAGAFGLLLFLVVFALGELVHVPGLVFVAAAIVAYGPVAGGLLGYVGALGSVTVSFFVVRGVGGQQLAGVERPFFKRMLARLDERPVRAVAVLRLLLWMAPPLNYALAMSAVRYRDYLVGSALGLVLPILASAAFIDVLLGLVGGS
ncbi:MAG: VTT domain-containing protein [Myxococcota bacterium]